MHFSANARWALLLAAQAALVIGTASNATTLGDLSLNALDEKLQVRPPASAPAPPCARATIDADHRK